MDHLNGERLVSASDGAEELLCSARQMLDVSCGHEISCLMVDGSTEPFEGCLARYPESRADVGPRSTVRTFGGDGLGQSLLREMHLVECALQLIHNPSQPQVDTFVNFELTHRLRNTPFIDAVASIMESVPLSVLDLAVVDYQQDPGSDGRGLSSMREAFAHTVDLARAAETGGYERVWYAEHHNMPSIASSATAVLIAHVANHTERIRLGAGGIMLPNHSPLIIAEQFGTLAELHPGRIDLGLGRAPGTDGATFRALRRSLNASDAFPDDVRELQALLGDELPRSGVNAYPGRGTKIPLTILGSSIFGASLAAALGLPYAFASHFAPQALTAAIAHYRAHYVPSEAHPEPYAYAGVNVIAAESDDEAERLFARAELDRVRRFLSRGRERELTEDEAASVMDSPAGQEVRGMMRYTAIGGPARVREELAAFAQHADADELITVHTAPSPEARLASVRIAAPADSAIHRPQ